MKKLISILLVCLMALSLCACGKKEVKQQEPAQESSTAPDAEVPEILSSEEDSKESIVSKVQGNWVSPDGYFLQFSGNRFSDGHYRGEGGLSGNISMFRNKEDNEYELTIHFPEGYIYEDPIPAHDETFIVKSDDGFKNQMTVTDDEGNVYECQYAGITDDELFAKCEEIVQ